MSQGICNGLGSADLRSSFLPLKALDLMSAWTVEEHVNSDRAGHMSGSLNQLA